MNGRSSSQIELKECESPEAELREHGLRILARWIAHSYLQSNIVKHNLESHAARQESVPAIAEKRRGRTINIEESKR